MPENLYILIIGAMVGVFGIIFLMIFLHAKNENKILQQKNEIAQNEVVYQKELARTLVNSQESERKRIGMNLHDEVGTALSALRLNLSKIAATSDPSVSAMLNLSSKNAIDNIIQNVRKISHDLSPFMMGAYELKDGLEDLTYQINTSGALSVSLNFEDVDKLSFLNEHTQLALYRILSELLNNTIKHAFASEASILFAKTDPLLTIVYNDNGVGMPNISVSKQGIGMANIESRCNAIGAAYAINESRQKGFEIKIMMPIA